MAEEPRDVPAQRPRSRDPADADRDAFFAIPRGKLYLGGLAAVAGVAATLALLSYLARYLHAWVIPLGLAGYTLLVFRLGRTSAGRGFLITFGRGYAPRTQLAAWIIITLLSVVALSYLTFFMR